MVQHRSVSHETSKVFRRALFGLVFLALSGCTGDQSGVHFSRPPIIVVDVDTLRADHLGCYGYQRDTSPNIDTFSREAVRFQWAFSQAPNTPPSQASILTSLYPTSHGRIGNETSISEEVTTLAEALGAAGYRTAAFVDGGLMAAGFGLERGFEIYDDQAGGVQTIGPKAKEWLNRTLASNSADKIPDPFFLLIHTYDVHSPYENSPEPYRSMFLDGLDMPSEYYRNNMSGVMAEVWNARHEKDPPKLSTTELDYAIAMYDSGIRQVDDWFGDFVSFLKTHGIYDQAIVVLISDHGDAFEEHGGLFHEKLYAEVTRIPFMIRFPGAAGAATFEKVVESIDLMPTLLERVGVEEPQMIQGNSLIPLIDRGRSFADLAVSESPFFGRRIAVTTSQYRLLYTVKTDGTELYRYREDLREQHDIAGQLLAETGRLRETAKRWQKYVHQLRHEGVEVQELAPEVIEQLRTLGYVQ